MVSTWGEPDYTNADAMQGPAQLSAVADFAMARGIRHFDTQALLIAAGGALEDYYAIVKNIPGALWRLASDGTTWEMVTPAKFSDRSGLANITTAAAGMVAFVGKYAVRYSGSAWVPYAFGAALIPLVPTLHAAVTGVSVGADGVITLTGVTGSPIFKSLFTTEFDNYVLESDLKYTVSGRPTMQLALAGTPATTAYDQQRNATVQATASADQDLNGGNWGITPSNNANVARHVLTTKLYGPALAAETLGRSDGMVTPNPMTAATSAAAGMRALQHRTATAYDGFALIGSGTVTGTIRCYALVNN